MIPKIIHYCWFGHSRLPRLARKCIKSWKKYCPDYEIKKWNEDNFDIDMFPYVREAYEHKKYAFVADVARLYALYHDGGIYMDTDVEVVKPLDPFLKHIGFAGFEEDENVGTCVLGSEKHSRWTKEFLDTYRERHFIKPDGSLDTTTNAYVLTTYLESNGLKRQDCYQDIPGFLTVYPQTTFSPLSYKDNPSCLTADTVAIHYFAGSWLTFEAKLEHSHPKLFKWWYWLVYLPRYEWRTKIMKRG